MPLRCLHALLAFAGCLWYVPACAGADIEALTKKLGKDLACSACAHSTHSLRMLLGSKVKKSMKRKEKRKVAKGVLTAACAEDRFPSQLSISGEEGKRQYADFQEMISKGGSLTNLNMKPENRKDVSEVCAAIASDLGAEIVEKAATYKDRLGGFNWERWLCVKQLQVCEATLMHQSDEDDDADEEPEEEL
mmetsp:Transcript_24152/g.60321  ORF Transcript_24152/g.60321 Transcript_24152/m.60321 type:complete len:191 (+) Transcript_24152:41-613(+)